MSPHKLLVANRGEIAVRILRTAKRLGIPTIAIYTRSDATAPHVLLADEAVALRPEDDDPVSNSRGYLDAETIVDVCKDRKVTLVHPGYGFLAENAHFASLLVEAGITWLGPRVETILAMGLKHQARVLAVEVNVPLVPGSEGLLDNVEDAVKVAVEIGFPIMLKSTAGGGGMGLVVCQNSEELRAKFSATQERARTLFKNDGLFLERYYPAARHVEVQVFGNGLGHAIHMGERECSVQRRHQKVIEETPSPFMTRHPVVLETMCVAAVRLCEHITYASAGTVEFLVEDVTGAFFFLEMNTRLQVEHPVTEAVNPGLDIVELMIQQGIAEREAKEGGLSADQLDQEMYQIALHKRPLHAIEARVYCENAAAQFKPCPGTLQQVDVLKADWLRVETWVETGTNVTPYFDPLVCKLIVTAPTRQEAVARLFQALSQSKIYGPPNNTAYLRAICESEIFQSGNATTTFLDTFKFIPRGFDVLSGGLDTTVQDYPGRQLGLGIPRSGPMDSLAFRIANILVGNKPGTEALEVTLIGCRLFFHTPTVIAITGASVQVTVNGQDVDMWKSVVVPARGKLAMTTAKEPGFRAYLAVRGGFPEIPPYLGSKATSMGLGGYQGRSLTSGDHIALGDCYPAQEERPLPLPPYLVPAYPTNWTIYCLAGPHSDEEFVTRAGIEEFFSTHWKVSISSNRMGIRLEGPQITWARKNGGEGGSHPSNIHDNGYALGTINLNGDTPVILTNEGPDMGGYVCICTVATAELWKLGQLRPGCTVRFKRITFAQALQLHRRREEYLGNLSHICSTSESFSVSVANDFLQDNLEDVEQDSKLHVISPVAGSPRPQVVFRQAGDSAILVEYGELLLDFGLRARIHAFESELGKRDVPGMWSLAPCIRSTMIHYDPLVISQSDLLTTLLEVEASLPDTLHHTTFPGRRITFPIVLDDRWSRDALERYMHSIRSEAVYLPSNIEYLAKNNGLEGGVAEALKLLVSSDWLVLGVGFYLACPFLVPIDPRCRLVGQKMNPSRTYTPRGAVGIAGLVAAIYPIESPGGYQLYARTLPPWQTWGKGRNFKPEQPWLLQPFDQVTYEIVTEEEYLEIEARFDAGRYEFKIEPTVFSMSEYNAFVERIAKETRRFKDYQAKGVETEEALEKELLAKWDSQRAQAAERLQKMVDHSDGDPTGDAVVSPLSASIWKIKCSPGDLVKSGEDVLIVLEAMKTEINVKAGEENVGRLVKGFGRGVKEGAAVSAGDILITLA
ncbi:Putative urea [Sparassis crispa]|uniref:Urea n=1 Tax=Sparassis crispa TaxID=139825 RepID=A0A401GTP2_9APHY|nr:Putative urea [Sparassis crispa]GBE85595.1 Putative urea [Sparassis crispa]